MSFRTNRMIPGFSRATAWAISPQSSRRPAIYRFDADPCGLRVYRGELSVDRDGGIQKAKVGQIFSFTGTPAMTRFDPKETDPVKTWADQRSRQRIQREKHLEEQRSMQTKRRSVVH